MADGDTITISRAAFKEVERNFIRLAMQVGIPLDNLSEASVMSMVNDVINAAIWKLAAPSRDQLITLELPAAAVTAGECETFEDPAQAEV